MPPVSENFDGVPVDGAGYSQGDSPRIINGWTIRLLDAGGNDAPATSNFIDVTQNGSATALAGPGDGAVGLTGDLGVVETVQFLATSGSEFWLQSFAIENLTAFSELRLEGYRDGSLVASQDFIETRLDNAGTVITVDHLLDHDWQRIDEFRIVQANGEADILFYIDDIVVAAMNFAPTATNLTQTVSYVEDDASVALADIVVSDADAGDTITATLTLSDAAAGALTTGSFGAATSSYDAATGVWTVSGALADVNAALADVAFIPAADWDQDITVTTLIQDASGAGPAAGTITLDVTPVNDAPSLSGGPVSATGTNEDTTSPGTPVSSLLAGLTFGDPDGPNSGIAITATSGNGTWQYSTDGLTWNTVGSVANGWALLLSASTQLRYIPDGANGETATLTFRAWDQSAGIASTNSAPSFASTTINGETTPFSTGTAQAQIIVTDVNDAPVLTPAAPSLSGIAADAVNNPGQTVASVIGASVSDIDNGAVEGIAINGLTGVASGTWQYSLDGGTSWIDVGAVSQSAALLLRETDHIRFVPDGSSGTTATFSYRAWDQTGATTGQQGTKVSLASPGGTSPFSSASDTASIAVTAANAAPVVTTSGGTTLFTEPDGPNDQPVVIDVGLTVSDADDTTLAAATVAITGNFRSGEDVLAFVNDGTSHGNVTASYNASTGILTLTSPGATATLAQWQAALRAVTYNNTSDTPDTAARTFSFVVDDGTDSSGAATKTVNVMDVNDTPVVIVPATQTTAVNQNLVIGSSDSNAVTVDDPDVGSGLMLVTISVDVGHISLTNADTSGVTMISPPTAIGSSLTFEGTLAQINAALDDMVYIPVLNHVGVVNFSIITNDQGNTGAGGPRESTESFFIAVGDLVPEVSAVHSLSPDGHYVAGDVITLAVVFNHAVNVDTSVGTPTLLLETGAIDREAVYLSGSGSDTLIFGYTVQAGDVSGDLDYHSTSALSLNGATIRGILDHDAVLTLPALGGPDSLSFNNDIIVDAVSPGTVSVDVPADGTYRLGQHLDFIVNFDEIVMVDTSGGAPRLGITLDTGGTVYAEYVSGSGSSALVFRFAVANGLRDTDGIDLDAALDLNGATIRDAAGNDAVLSLVGVGSTTGIRVDSISSPGTPEPEPDPEPLVIHTDDDGHAFATGAWEHFIGRDRTDTVTFTGSREDYTITRNADGTYSIEGDGRPDILTSIERLQFDDGILALDVDANPGLAFRLYQAAFDRTPDPEGLGYWIDRLDNDGIDLLWIAHAFLLSEEFSAVYGDPAALSGEEFVNLLYWNALDREAEEEGFAYWQQAVIDGASYQWLLAVFSESQENRDNVAPIIGDGIWYH